LRAAKKSARTFAVTSAAQKAADLKERALIASAITELAKFTEEERAELADKGFALPDGSYPIRNEEDLKNAIRAYGRAEKSKRVSVRKHIIKRARALKKESLIPENWTNAGSAEASSIVAAMRARISEFAESDNKEISDKELEELKNGKEFWYSAEEAQARMLKRYRYLAGLNKPKKTKKEEKDASTKMSEM
jgi:D-mannonate dehydratase